MALEQVQRKIIFFRWLKATFGQVDKSRKAKKRRLLIVTHFWCLLRLRDCANGFGPFFPLVGLGRKPLRTWASAPSTHSAEPLHATNSRERLRSELLWRGNVNCKFLRAARFGIEFVCEGNWKSLSDNSAPWESDLENEFLLLRASLPPSLRLLKFN